MGRIAAIGAEAAIRGFQLAGVLLLPAERDEGVRAAWQRLPDDVELVILTAAARRALAPSVGDADRPLLAVIPP